MSLIWSKGSTKCSQVIDISSDLDLIEEKLMETSKSHLFSKNIQLITTNSDLKCFTEDYIQSTENLSYYLVKNIPIYVFINKILINGFVKTGRLSGVSINNEIDFDDCFALLPNGLIVLSVKESTYQRMGIVGKKSILYKKKNCVKKYLIEIDLNDEHLTPGTKYYRRTEECLQKSGLFFDIFIKWEVTDEDLTKQSISSMSLGNIFSYIRDNSSDDSLKHFHWCRCSPSFRSFDNKQIPIPIVNRECLSEDIQTLIEWFGAQICQINCDLSEDSDVSTFGISHYQKREDIHCVSINGFFTSSDIESLFDSFKQKIVKKSDKDITAFIVNGFEDTPIAWSGRNNEHSKNLSGENMFGIGSQMGIAFIWRVTDEYDFGIERL